MPPGFMIEVVNGDAMSFQADVLMIKYSPRSGGLDSQVRAKLRKSGSKIHESELPRPGEYQLLPAPPEVGSKWVLMVGTRDIFHLGYPELRELGHDMLAGLQTATEAVTHVATTAHGVNTALSLDEEEAFRALLLGFADAWEAGIVPPTLKKITIVEFTIHRYELFKEALNRFLPPDPVETISEAIHETAEEVANIISGVDSFEETYQKPVADEQTPHVFVAMPFSDDFDDHYYLAIRPAITENNLLCVRLDQDESVFTGDIMEQVKERIRTAELVVALLDSRNPNVYLEIGYAWGVGTPTILILHEEEKPPFDVQGARILGYKRMHRLKEQLTQELNRLREARS